jgi:hypothetical protein
MEVGDQLHPLVALPLEKQSQLEGGWVDLTTDLVANVKRKILISAENRAPVPQFVVSLFNYIFISLS